MSKDQYIAAVIRHNYIVRFFSIPLFYIKQYAILMCYWLSKDSQYVRTLRNKHRDERCFIIGNGPSLTAKDLDSLKNEITFASNRIYKMYDLTELRPTYYLCTDPFVAAEIKPVIRELKDSIKFLANGRCNKTDCRCGIHCLAVAPWYSGIRPEKYVQKKFTTNIHRYVSRTQTVTCTAIEMAVYMGMKEIYLLGVDHTFAVEKLKDGTKVFHKGVKNHFEGGESSLEVIESMPAHIEASTQCYQICQDYALAHGIRIYNCTRGGGKLEVFEKKDFEKVIGKME